VKAQVADLGLLFSASFASSNRGDHVRLARFQPRFRCVKANGSSGQSNEEALARWLAETVGAPWVPIY
jgi:hypothetical protein